MADPLTASDMWRIERGLGTSSMASPEERRRFAAAGQLPLNSMDVAKFAEGRGISPMAGTAEKEAWKMAEYMGGRREQAPISYGGLGDRPVGSSRRAIRMQDEWDKKQMDMLQQQRLAQQIQQANLAEQREGFRFTKEQNEYAAKLNLDTLNEKTAAQESSEANAIASGLNSIDFKTDPEAGLKIDQLVLNNPLGATRKDVAERIEAARNISSTYGLAATTKADQEARKAKSDIINSALRDGVTEQEIERTKFADPKTAVVDYNYEEIAKLAAQKVGERKTKEPEEEVYKPISVAEARDRRDIIKAEFDELDASVQSGKLDDDDSDYVKTKARLRRAEAELKVAEGVKQPQAGGAKPKELSPRDQSALDWANANPDDPRSSKIKQRLGVE